MMPQHDHNLRPVSYKPSLYVFTQHLIDSAQIYKLTNLQIYKFINSCVQLLRNFIQDHCRRATQIDATRTERYADLDRSIYANQVDPFGDLAPEQFELEAKSMVSVSLSCPGPLQYIFLNGPSEGLYPILCDLRQLLLENIGLEPKEPFIVATVRYEREGFSPRPSHLLLDDVWMLLDSPCAINDLGALCTRIRCCPAHIHFWQSLAIPPMFDDSSSGESSSSESSSRESYSSESSSRESYSSESSSSESPSPLALSTPPLTDAPPLALASPATVHPAALLSPSLLSASLLSAPSVPLSLSSSLDPSTSHKRNKRPSSDISDGRTASPPTKRLLAVRGAV
jgi:hypothetical protein